MIQPLCTIIPINQKPIILLPLYTIIPFSQVDTITTQSLAHYPL